MIDYEERNKLIVAAYVRGQMSLAAVGRRFGIGPERVRQIVARNERSIRIAARRFDQRATLIKLLKSHFQI